MAPQHGCSWQGDYSYASSDLPRKVEYRFHYVPLSLGEGQHICSRGGGLDFISQNFQTPLKPSQGARGWATFSASYNCPNRPGHSLFSIFYLASSFLQFSKVRVSDPSSMLGWKPFATCKLHRSSTLANPAFFIVPGELIPTETSLLVFNFGAIFQADGSSG